MRKEKWKGDNLERMKAIYFSTPADFRRWLLDNHSTEKELLVGFYKVDSGKPSMKWSESVDEALCFGWIDGVRKSVDDKRYTIRFTPRRATSIWSAINLKKMKLLIRKGLVLPAGLAVYNKRKKEKTNIYSHENDLRKLNPRYEKQFRSSKKAWNFFISSAPSYQRVCIHWIMSAKQEETQKSRLQKLMESSQAGLKLT